MIRLAARGMAVAAAIALVLSATRAQQPGAIDRIVVRDKDKKDGSTKNYDGTLKVGPAGILIQSAEGKLLATIAPSDIAKVVPGELVGVDRTDLLAQISLEDKKTRKDNETARIGYKALLAKASAAPPRTKQFLAFRIASLTTKILDESDDDEWAKQVDAALKEWDDYLDAYKTGWEVWPAARISARLYVESNKFRDAAKVWKLVGGKDYELPADLKIEAALQTIDDSIREGPGGYPNATATAEATSKAAIGQVAKDKLAIYSRTAAIGASPAPEALASAVKDIESKIAATKDPSVRAVAYGMIGELYLASKRPRDAMWAFLAVETLYNTDKDEVFKSLVRLAQLFKLQADEDHEKLYRDKIRRLRQQL